MSKQKTDAPRAPVSEQKTDVPLTETYTPKPDGVWVNGQQKWAPAEPETKTEQPGTPAEVNDGVPEA